MIRELVVDRSDGYCEAMIQLANGVWTRCGRSPIEDHHALTRARGGDILDALGEIYHHIALCYRHHKYAHEERDGGEMIIDGSVYRDGPYVVYQGNDEYLSGKYGRQMEVLFL